MILITSGAEAEIYESENMIIKRRVKKNYRIDELDSMLNKTRTKREVNIIKKLNALNIPSPMFYTTNKYDIVMEKIKGIPVKNILNNESLTSNQFLNKICAKTHKDILIEIGNIVYAMHNNNIIHGDLTTLNFIYSDKIHIIDFGLSFYSNKDEDKAVDLYLFEKSLISVHNEEFVSYFYFGYIVNETLNKKLLEIRKRGRKRE